MPPEPRRQRARAAAPRRRYSSYFVNGKSVPDIWSWLRKNYWAFPKGLFWSSVYVWIPIQVVNLYWVPLPFRVLYMNVSVMVRSLPCPRVPALPPLPLPPAPIPPPLSRSPARPAPSSQRVRLQMWTVYLAAKLNREQALKSD